MIVPSSVESRQSALPIASAAGLVEWLIEEALPVWSGAGVDNLGGGFFEKIDMQGRPIEAPRRTRVVARQIYVFATATRRGWLAIGDELVEHGFSFLFQKLRLDDGVYASAVRPDGTVVDARFDLYEQAFALFAMAEASRRRPDRLARLAPHAEALLTILRRRWQHPVIGFEESEPRALPLRSNPHMHLLEAALSWLDVCAESRRGVWVRLAEELVELCLRHLVAADTGAVRECFDGDWRTMPEASSRAVEPGHQFEWGWLLTQWARRAGHATALRVATRLIDLGEASGVDDARGVAVNLLDEHLNVTDASAKVWPQTERIKAWHAAGVLAAQSRDAERAAVAHRSLVDAVRGLSQFFVASPAGLWREQLNVDGSFASDDCRASSLYHIVCAIDTLQSERH